MLELPFLPAPTIRLGRFQNLRRTPTSPLPDKAVQSAPASSTVFERLDLVPLHHVSDHAGNPRAYSIPAPANQLRKCRADIVNSKGPHPLGDQKLNHNSRSRRNYANAEIGFLRGKAPPIHNILTERNDPAA